MCLSHRPREEEFPINHLRIVTLPEIIVTRSVD